MRKGLFSLDLMPSTEVWSCLCLSFLDSFLRSHLSMVSPSSPPQHRTRLMCATRSVAKHRRPSSGIWVPALASSSHERNRQFPLSLILNVSFSTQLRVVGSWLAWIPTAFGIRKQEELCEVKVSLVYLSEFLASQSCTERPCGERERENQRLMLGIFPYHYSPYSFSDRISPWTCSSPILL